jgi:hypothetical protein
MPGFLGGSSSASSSTGGTINFPTEFIDPVTKLRISQPENLIDTDFEYGLQPTKWETVELINNIPSFFSKSGDTTIPNVLAITTIVGSREITVRTSLDHGLSVGIPINVSGTKSITADGAYIINSIPNARTFTYLARENQFQTAGIEDLYTAIITGEFFQGSQIKISEAAGIVTDAETPSVLTVKTDSPHGFGPNTPLYFLNLNSSITQEFDSTNTEAKSFDASNNVTARTFDGSNTVQSINIDFSNRAASSPISVASSVSGVNTVDNEITVTHSSENFNGRQIGTALQYNVNAASGYFADNPRGVVFLKTSAGLGAGSSTFKVSATPDGSVIAITSNITGTFQIADLVATFAGNNSATEDQINITLTQGTAYEFDGDNSETATYTVSSIGGLGSVTFTANTNWTIGQMVRYSTTGAAATGLTNNTTYWVTALNANTNLINISAEPGGPTLTAISGGTGTQTFTSISVSLDRDIIAIPGHDFQEADMVRYSYPEDGRMTTASDGSDYYFVKKVYDSTFISLSSVKGFVRDGTTEPRAATSAAAILAVAPGSPSGSYWIKPAGSETAYLTYCEMTTAGGGWTQIMKLSSNTLLTNNTSTNVAAPVSGAQHTFAPNWDGWAWNQDSQFTTLFPLVNNSTFADVDSFSPLFYKMPFNDVMIMQISNPANAIAWRHNLTLANMRAVTGGTNNSTYGNTWLFPTAFVSTPDEWSMVRRLGTHTSTTQLVLQTGGRFGFKVLSDYSNGYGTIGNFVTGGYTTLTSDNVTGNGVSMIGMGGTGTSSGRWGGGIGFTYVTGPRAWRGSGHWWQQGDTSGATANRAFLNLAVFVRPL